MTFSVDQNVSAIQAVGRKMSGHANRIATMSVDSVENADETIESAVNNNPLAKETDFDMAREMVGMMRVEKENDMNVTAIKIQDEMIGTIIDMIG